MKKLYLSLMAMLLVFSCYGQELKPESKNINDVMLVRKFGSPVPLSAPMENPVVVPAKAFAGVYETEIIETKYDLQSRGALSNRIWTWPGNAEAAVCNQGQLMVADTFTDRRTGYNYYNGSAWNPGSAQGLEDLRTGSPSIAGWNGSGEIVVSQDLDNNRLYVLTRAVHGTGDWTTHMLDGPEGGPGIGWPRMTTSGSNHNIIHVFALSIPSPDGGFPWLGQDGALLYSRSADGGETWDILHQQLPGIGQENYLNINPDDYALVARDSIVVLLAGSPWRDLVMWKSTDNGTTWNKTVIWEHPYPFFDLQSTYTTDTLWTVDGSFDAGIDAYGTAHVAWGLARVARLEYNPPPPGYFQYWPMTDGIGYWNETMQTPVPPAENPHHTLMTWRLYGLGMLAGWSPDVNGSGVLHDYEGTADPPFGSYRQLGISSMPSITWMYAETMELAYASVTETYLTGDGAYNYRHIWMKNIMMPGFTDIQAGNMFHFYDECIYPQFSNEGMGGGSSDYPGLIYQADNYPGLYCDGNQAVSANRVISYSILTLDSDPVVQPACTQFECIPNPAAETVAVKFELREAYPVKVQVFNLAGQCVLTLPMKTLNKGAHTLRVNVSGLKAGLYLCTLTSGQEKSTTKLAVK